MNILPKKLYNKWILSNDKLKMLNWRELNGCPEIVDASYSGYTGIKIFKFPTSDSFNSFAYPDITNAYEHFKLNLLKEVTKKKSEVFGNFKVLKMFLANFSTGEKWDTKFIEIFPGRDKLGRVQYAIFNDKIVPGNYLSNHLYGFLCASIGIPENVSKFIARMYSKGFIEPLISGEIPNKTLLKFRDPIADQQAISAGYNDFRKSKLN